MNEDRRKRTPQIEKVVRTQAIQELRALSDADLFMDIDRSKAMRRHPFATRFDADYYTFRISAARRELHRRLRKELEAL